MAGAVPAAAPGEVRGAPGAGVSTARPAAANPPESSLLSRTRIAVAAPAPASRQTGQRGTLATDANPPIRALRPSSTSRGGGLIQDSSAARSRSTLGSAVGTSASPSRDAGPRSTSAAPRAVGTTPTPSRGGVPAVPGQRTGATGNRPAASKGPSGRPVAPVAAVGPATGTLRLSGLAGSRYYVDGVLVRPKKGLVTVPEGVHDINIVLPNRSSQRRRVTVHRGETVVIGR